MGTFLIAQILYILPQCDTFSAPQTRILTTFRDTDLTVGIEEFGSLRAEATFSYARATMLKSSKVENKQGLE